MQETPEDVKRVIIAHALAYQKPSWYRGRDDKRKQSSLRTYFALPLVSSQFHRVFTSLLATVDWGKLLVDHKWPSYKLIEMKPVVMQRISRALLYNSFESSRLHEEIDVAVATHGVTYRSPVRRLLNKGKLSLKKLRHASYPSGAIKTKVLDTLRAYERLQRERQAIEKRYRSRFS